MAKKRILTQDEIDRYMNNSDELSEDGLEYSVDDVDFYLTVFHLMKIRIATVEIVLTYKIQFRILKKSDDDKKLDRNISVREPFFKFNF
ncbi:uncharacterized protein TNIN_100301 [Trichonephila inaurata madagascariensis]|uniref:Uncharacterized protein n=1 Tax=Trichonephila inaurata madagascariensis TaxID=2747483 RepID=A0A8X6YAH7_9ARAC|nr:uncharacterized protein TNIN_100301 [Trichonephila inaurata madagascariensis]